MAVLKLEGVTRHFGGVQAVKDLSMTVSPGRITGLIGPNGAGKTTAVNMIAGLLKLTAGRISLDDLDIHELPPHEIARLGVARTFQKFGCSRKPACSTMSSSAAGKRKKCLLSPRRWGCWRCAALRAAVRACSIF